VYASWRTAINFDRQSSPPPRTTTGHSPWGPTTSHDGWSPRAWRTPGCGDQNIPGTRHLTKA